MYLRLAIYPAYSGNYAKIRRNVFCLPAVRCLDKRPLGSGPKQRVKATYDPKGTIAKNDITGLSSLIAKKYGLCNLYRHSLPS